MWFTLSEILLANQNYCIKLIVSVALYALSIYFFPIIINKVFFVMIGDFASSRLYTSYITKHVSFALALAPEVVGVAGVPKANNVDHQQQDEGEGEGEVQAQGQGQTVQLPLPHPPPSSPNSDVDLSSNGTTDSDTLHINVEIESPKVQMQDENIEIKVDNLE